LAIIFWLYRRHRVNQILREIRGEDYVEPEKGSKWLSRIPFAKRFGYRSVRKSQTMKHEDQDDHDFQYTHSPVGRTSISEDSSAEPPAYSKESYDKSPDSAKGDADQQSIPEHETANHTAQSEHTHNSEKVDNTPAFPIPHPNV